jgi:cytochrome c oxidase subunit 2
MMLAAVMGLGAGEAVAQAAAPAPAVVATEAVANAATPDAAPAPAAPEAATNAAAPAAAAALPAPPPRMKPTPGIGQPTPRELGFQQQFTSTGKYALWMHNAILMPLITAICLFVLALLLWVMVRYRKSANPEASRTSHNTFIEVVWTLVPVFILIGVAIPSIDLLAKQFKPAPKDAVTVKVTGYQWYWGYEYPDNEIPEFVSNLLPEEKAVAEGEPYLLAVDNRLVLPVGVPIKLIITAADVIHSFSVPAFWVKEDAVPGRLNEKTFTIDKPGVYYGVCSELCGARHGFMPIAVEALPREQYAQWVLSQGGKLPEGWAVPAAAKPEVPATAQQVASCQADVNALLVGKTIEFDTAKATISAKSQGLVDQLAGKLATCAGTRVIVGGHTDAVGDAAANKALSEARAKAVYDALVAKNVPPARLSAVGYGSSKPKVPGATEAANAANRRIDFAVAVAN